MLDDTLSSGAASSAARRWGRGRGRDHHILGFSLWMAGGGIKGGVTYGATDELGYRAVEDVVHVRDLHATILAPLRHRPRAADLQVPGLDVRLTDVSGKVVKGIVGA